MLNISKFLATTTTANIFFNEPTKPHYLMEVSKRTNVAHTSTKNYLTQLEKLSVLKKSYEKKGKRIFPLYNANLDSPIYKRYKKIYNLLKLEDSGLIDYLRDAFMPKAIILFGSYARGEDVEDSDIDIFVESKKKEVNLARFERLLNRKIELHFKEDFKDYPKELKNNIINGTLLYGYLEAF